LILDNNVFEANTYWLFQYLTYGNTVVYPMNE